MVKTRISGSRNCIFGRKTVTLCATLTQNLHKRLVTRRDSLHVAVIEKRIRHTYTKMPQIVYVSQRRSFVPLLQYPEMPFLVFTIYTRTEKSTKTCTCVCSSIQTKSHNFSDGTEPNLPYRRCLHTRSEKGEDHFGHSPLCFCE